MSQLKPRTSRRISLAKGTVVFTFYGDLYAPREGFESAFLVSVPVTLHGETKHGGIIVKQHHRGAKVICETWYPLAA